MYASTREELRREYSVSKTAVLVLVASGVVIFLASTVALAADAIIGTDGDE